METDKLTGLAKKDPECRNLILYADDFAKTYHWDAVCDQLGVDRSAYKLSLAVYNVEEGEEDE